MKLSTNDIVEPNHITTTQLNHRTETNDIQLEPPKLTSLNPNRNIHFKFEHYVCFQLDRTKATLFESMQRNSIKPLRCVVVYLMGRDNAHLQNRMELAGTLITHTPACRISLSLSLSHSLESFISLSLYIYREIYKYICVYIHIRSAGALIDYMSACSEDAHFLAASSSSASTISVFARTAISVRRSLIGFISEARLPFAASLARDTLSLNMHNCW